MNQRRRELLKLGVISLPVCAGVAAIPWDKVLAADKEPKVLKNPMAKALQYVEDASKAPMRKDKSAFCCNCSKYKKPVALKGGKCPDPDARAACEVIANEDLRAAGWCLSWQKAPVG